MKNIAKYGIVLLSVAVLAATNSVVTVVAETAAPAAAETAAPAVSKVRVGIFYGVNSPNPVKEWNIELKEGESYTAEAPSIAGYKFVMGAHYDGGQVREFHTKTYTIKYMSFQGMPEDQSLAFYYELDDPGQNPGQPENPTPTPAQTQKFDINYWTLRAGGGVTPLGTETVEVSPGETHTVQKKDFPGYEFQGASIDNGATGTDVELPYNLKYGDSNQGIDLIYKKKSQKPADPQKPAEPEKPGQPEKPADPEKPAPNPGQPETPIPAPTPTPTPQPTPNPSDNGNNSNQGNKLNPSDNKPSDNGNGKSENPTDNQNPAKNGNDSTPSDNGEKQNNSNQGDNNRDTTKQSEINKPNETTKNKLPNTGEAVSSLGFLGVGLLSSLGLAKKRYKGRHERH